MPAISKIRLTNVVYEDGDKRYNDEVFHFDGHNGAIVLENGGGKTVFIHTVLQAVFPHTNLGDRKIKETLRLEDAPAHIGIEWIKNENPRRYVTTCVSLYLTKDGLGSLRYVFEYDADSSDRLEMIPFVHQVQGGERAAGYGEILDYYHSMKNKSMYAETFSTISSFREYIEEHHHIIANEWENIVQINGDEGGIDKFFENCRTTNDLYDRLLIPVVEGSIQGHQAGTFADMFEKQRESFHKYKKLSESMKENKLIHAELEKYVHVFERFTEKETNYIENKEHAKGLWTILHYEKENAERGQADHLERQNELDQEAADLRWRRASFEVFLEKQKHRELEAAHREYVVVYEEAKERLAQLETKYDSLQYAKLKQHLKMSEEQLKNTELELDRQEKHENLPDLESQMEAVNRALKGYFVNEQEVLKQSIKEKKFELRPLEKTRDDYIKKEAELKDARTSSENEQAALEAGIQFRTERADKIKQEILAHPNQENVADEKKKWEKRRLELDEAVVELIRQEKQMNQRLETLVNDKDRIVTEQHQTEISRNRMKEYENRLQEEHDVLIHELGKIKMRWSGITDLYMQEHSIYEELNEMNQRLFREQEDLLQKERMARSLLDDFEEQDMFFGDAFLLQQLHTLKNQLDYLVSGVEFFQNLSEEQKETYRNYPLWPVTLITTKRSKPVLFDHLQSMRDRMHIPVQVLTLEEVRTLDWGSAKDWVEPVYWETNLDQQMFVKWKEELKEQAEEVTVRRKAKDNEVTALAIAWEHFNQFFVKYSNQDRERLKEGIKEFEEKLRMTEVTLKKIEEEMKSLTKEQETNRTNIEAYRNEISGLDVRLEKAQECIRLEKEIRKNEIKLEFIKQEIKRLNVEINAVTRQLKRYNEDIDYVKEEMKDAERDLKAIERDDDYKLVLEERADFTGEEKAVILERRRSLELKIYNIEESYRELKVKIEYTEKEINRLKSDLMRLKEERQEIDEMLVFPPNGESLLESLGKRIKGEEEKVENQNTRVMQEKSELDQQIGKVEMKIEEYNRQFSEKEMARFQESSSEMERLLVNEQKKLKERYEYWQQEKERLDKESDHIQSAIQELDRFQEAHQFTSTHIEGTVFSESEVTNFIYQRLQIVKEATKRLKRSKEEVEEGLKDVDRAKQNFRRFCEREIKDIKLGRMATDGIEQKESYEGILQFRKNMMVRLDQADRVAREYISNNDKDLQAFIDRIHHHLRTVTEQLLIIPKKTRVKIGETWKEIYKFTIPEWTEEEGKERIREHIYWILDQLDSTRFLNDRGMKDAAKVRHSVEKWLETKQLLQIVMNNEKMNASCRKVTNDNQVGTRFRPWEESNKWSGGEKWSKNMTLFLGILNFVAEKKKDVARGKRNRAVILDNPFGKASSEHVLSPVFFIAEQLGFQIIALTAHAEGKFLQDYFPVLYSCRLRASVDSRKKIMMKEKTLNHAYFRDHEPASLERLGKTEQIKLF
jgi:hypothetical protein